MRIVNIAPLHVEHKAEVVADLLKLKRECGITDAAFMMSLHPERKPLSAKVNELCSRFKAMKRSLKNSGLRVGILIQSSISHGEKGGTLSDAGFQTIVASDGAATVRFCPLDKGFVKYIHKTTVELCRAGADFLVVDDDFRLMLNSFGCFCPLHMERFNQRVSGSYTRETLMEVLQKDDEQSRRLGAIWNEVSKDSLVALSKAIREGINTVDSSITCDYSTYIGEFQFARSIAQALAGNYPLCVHVNDAWYLEHIWYSSLGYKYVPKRLFHTAVQVAAVTDVPEILMEADTFFHNQYSLSAKSLHGHIVGSLLNGTTGVKVWMTVMTDHEPASGLAYRAGMAENHKLYAVLKELLPGTIWQGPATPLPAKQVSNWNPVVWEKQARQGSWNGDVCGRLGIPSQIGGHSADVNMLWGNEVDFFTDNELRQFCAKGLLLDGLAAEFMCRRGFSRQIGVNVDRPGWRLSGERYTDHPVNGSVIGKCARISNASLQVRRLIPLDAKAQILSRLFQTPWQMSPDEEDKGPGLTLFENDLGGRVAVYAGVELSGFTLNESRKEQLCNVMGWLARKPLSVVVLGTQDLYVRHGVIAPAKGGGELLAVFNLNQDMLSELALRVAGSLVAGISRLTGTGKWVRQSWRKTGKGTLVIETPVETMVPLIFRIRRGKESRTSVPEGGRLK